MMHQFTLPRKTIKASQDRCKVAYVTYLKALRDNKDKDPLAQAHLRKICTQLSNYIRIKDSTCRELPALIVAL